MIGAYWLFLSGIVFITSALILRAIITIPSGADDCIPTGKNKTVREMVITIIFTISTVSLIANIIHVILHCSVMTGIPLSEIFSVLPLFLLKTRYGMFSLIRTILMAMIFLVLLFALKKNDNQFAATTGTVLSLLLLITIAMSGHQGTKGYSNLPFVLDVFHIFAIAVWVGGIFFIRSCYSFFLKTTERKFWDIFLLMINKLSMIAVACVVVIITTGTILTFYSTEDISQVITTIYGNILLTKIALALLMMMLGGINKFLLLPGMNNIDQGNWSSAISLRSKLNVTLTIEVILGASVLLATAILTHISPGE